MVTSVIGHEYLLGFFISVAPTEELAQRDPQQIPQSEVFMHFFA